MAGSWIPRTRSPLSLTTSGRRPATRGPKTWAAPWRGGGAPWTRPSGPTSRSTTPAGSAPYVTASTVLINLFGFCWRTAPQPLCVGNGMFGSCALRPTSAKGTSKRPLSVRRKSSVREHLLSVPPSDLRENHRRTSNHHRVHRVPSVST